MICTTPRAPSFFLVTGIIGLLAAIIGFSKTFFIPVSSGEFKAPLIIHVHGMLAFAWIVLYLGQACLIRYHKYNIHRFLGFLAIVIAAGFTLTTVPVGMFVVNRDVAQTLNPSSYSSLVGTISSGLMFFVLVVAGIIQRNNPQSHKRLMFLATVVILWPAWFRFRHYFPWVPRPEIWFALVLADSLIVAAWIWDKLKNGRIHPVFRYAGALIIIEQSLEVYAYDSRLWRAFAIALYDILQKIT